MVAGCGALSVPGDIGSCWLRRREGRALAAAAEYQAWLEQQPVPRLERYRLEAIRAPLDRETAREHSEFPSAASGGAVGWLTSEQLAGVDRHALAVPAAFNGFVDSLYINQGDGTFSEEGRESAEGLGRRRCRCPRTRWGRI